MGGCPHRHSAPGVLVFRPGGSGRADGAPAASGRRGRRGRASGMASELRCAVPQEGLGEPPRQTPPRSQDVDDAGDAARQLGVQVLAVGIDYP